jgi:transposase
VLVVWLVRRANSRPCPRCGSLVRTGKLTCDACGFDFSTVGSPPTGHGISGS